jgi:hypothetical protein
MRLALVTPWVLAHTRLESGQPTEEQDASTANVQQLLSVLMLKADVLMTSANAGLRIELTFIDTHPEALETTPNQRARLFRDACVEAGLDQGTVERRLVDLMLKTQRKNVAEGEGAQS